MNRHAVRAIFMFEMARFYRTISQSIVGPVISTSLYFIVFGSAIGSRMTEIEGVGYAAFIVPGLTMLSLLNESISNASFGIYMPKFSGTIYEVLSAPISYVEIVLGYVGAAAAKSVIIGTIILITARVFVTYHVAHPLWMVAFLILTSVTFSLFGFIIGLWADGFQKLQLVPMLIVTPLTFLGGSFYSIKMLPPFWQKLTLFNPVVYLVNGFRWSFYDASDVSVGVSFGVTLLFLFICLGVTRWLIQSGYRLKNRPISGPRQLVRGAAKVLPRWPLDQVKMIGRFAVLVLALLGGCSGASSTSRAGVGGTSAGGAASSAGVGGTSAGGAASSAGGASGAVADLAGTSGLAGSNQAGAPGGISGGGSAGEGLEVGGSNAGGGAGIGGEHGLPTRASVLQVLRRANAHFVAKWPDPGKAIDSSHPSHIWTRAVYYEGLLGLYGVDPKPSDLSYAVAWGTAHSWGLNSGTTTRSADNQCAGQTYLALYQIEPEATRIKDIQTNIDLVVAGAKVDDWTWVDAIQMAMPVFAKLGAISGDKAYYDKMYVMYSSTKNAQGAAGFYSKADHLWWRDADFDPPYTEPNAESCYWSRGNGWAFAALTRVLDTIPESEPHRPEYLADFKAMAEALRAVQRTDGFWNVSLHDPTHFGGPELTGTSLFAYGMAWGVRKGLLSSANYQPVIERAWAAMASAVHDDGFLGYVQGTGKEPADGQPVTFDKQPNYEDFGLGCFLLGGSEVARLAPQ